MSRRLTKVGDMVRVDCPGTVMHGCYGIVLEEIDRGITYSHGYQSYPSANYGDMDYQILLSNPPEKHPRRVMLRGKWLRVIISHKDEKNP